MKENNGGNSGPLTSLPVDRLTVTDRNANRLCQQTVTIKIYQMLGALQTTILGPAEQGFLFIFFLGGRHSKRWVPKKKQVSL